MQTSYNVYIDLETMGIKGGFSLYIIMKKEDAIKESFLWKYTILIFKFALTDV